jgi:2-hydroxychromene-2-carboxylate isomerase
LKDYSNSVVKDKRWKETAEEVQAKGKIGVLKYFVHHKKAYWGFETVNLT